MRYVQARLGEIVRDRTYRIYITDVLRGALLDPKSPRYADAFNVDYKAETRTAEEIISSIKAKIGE